MLGGLPRVNKKYVNKQINKKHFQMEALYKEETLVRSFRHLLFRIYCHVPCASIKHNCGNSTNSTNVCFPFIYFTGMVRGGGQQFWAENQLYMQMSKKMSQNAHSSLTALFGIAYIKIRFSCRLNNCFWMTTYMEWTNQFTWW